MDTPLPPLPETIEAFLTLYDMAPVTFGRLAANDPHFVRDIRGGRRVWPEAEASSVRVDGFDLRHGRAGIRVRGDARHLVIRNGKMTTKGITKGSDLPAGIDIGRTVHDVLIEA